MINSWVNEYVGIPYQLHRQDHSACDCYGLVHLIYKEIYSVLLPTYFDEYTSKSSQKDLENLCIRGKKFWTKVPKHQEREGDVIYLRANGFEMHVGVVVGDGKFIHNSLKIKTSALSEYSNIKWRNRLLGFWRYE